MAEKTTKAKEPKRLSDQKVYEISLLAINKNTNPRNPLSASLQSQGWDCMTGEKPIWLLATSSKAEDRAMFVQLIQDFDPELASLAATIRSVGLESPIEVREGGGGGVFTLVYGSRRCLATLFNWCLLGKPKDPWIKATLVKGNEAHLLTRAIIENVRKNQTPIDEAKAIQLSVNLGETKENIAETLGVSIQTVNSRMQLLELSPKEQRAIQEGKVTVKDAKRAHAEANGKPSKEPKTPMRSRKEVESALSEYAERTPEHRVLSWMLGVREKIS